MGRALVGEMTRWFARLAEVSPEEHQRIGDLLDGVVFDLVLGAEAARVQGQAGNLVVVAVPAAPK